MSTPTRLWRQFTTEIRHAADRYIHIANRVAPNSQHLTAVTLGHSYDWQIFSPHHFLRNSYPANATLWIGRQLLRPITAVAIVPHTTDPPVARVARWCTLPTYRHQRLGTELLHICAIAAILTPVELRLVTHSTNTVEHLVQSGLWTISATFRYTGCNHTTDPQDLPPELQPGQPMYRLTPNVLALVNQGDQ
jgi:hypothetical protein